MNQCKNKSEENQKSGLIITKNIQSELIKIFGKDLTDEIACEYVAKMWNHSNIEEKESVSDIKEKLTIYHYELGRKIFGPVIVPFVYELLTKYNKGDTIYFLERDGLILKQVADMLLGEYPHLNHQKYDTLILTRAFLGISDEIAGIDECVEQNGAFVREYLAQKGVTSKSLLVDTGCYGSIVHFLRQNVYSTDNMPGLVFFFSKNPNIYGYLQGGYPQSLTTESLLLDALECQIPKMYTTPHFDQVAIKNDEISYTPAMIDYPLNLGENMLEGLHSGILQYIKDTKPDFFDYLMKNTIDNIYSTYTKNPLTISSGTPTWTSANSFIKERNDKKTGKINHYLDI